jgi:hypothetical protein
VVVAVVAVVVVVVVGGGGGGGEEEDRLHITVYMNMFHRHQNEGKILSQKY